MGLFFLLFLCTSFLNGYDDLTSYFVAHSGFYKGVFASNVASVMQVIPKQNDLRNTIRFHAAINQQPFQYYFINKPLEHLSVPELANYFAQAPPEEIFCKRHITAILSDAFVTYIKQFPEYEGYIEHFHQKYHTSSLLKKWWRKNVGKRLCQLHQELKTEKQAREFASKNAALQEYTIQKLEQKHIYLFAQWQKDLTTADGTQGQRIAQRIHAYHVKNYAALSVQHCVLSSQASQWLHEYTIDQNQLTSVYGSAVEHHLQDEFIQLTEAAVKHTHNSVHQLFVQGIDVGAAALQQKHTVLAAQIADFCWATLDLIQAAAEGVVFAGYDAAVFVHRVVCHPQETVYGIIDGICALADTLFIINDLPDQLREHDIPNKEHYYQKIADAEARLEMLGAKAAQSIKEMKPRDWVKHGTAFVVEGFLLHKVTNLTANACSRLGSLLGDLAQSVKYEEVVAACIDGELGPINTLNSTINNTTTKMPQAKESVIATVTNMLAERFTEETDVLLSLLEKLEAVDSNKVHHILQEKHMWNRLCANNPSWDSVKKFLAQAIKYGEEIEYKGLPSRVLKIGEEVVQLVYIRTENGLKISNAWIKNGNFK